MSDPVNSPEHYKSGGFEAADVLDAFFPDNPHLWAAGKYILRAGKKDPGKFDQDLEKAKWFIDRAINSRKARNRGNWGELLK